MQNYVDNLHTGTSLQDVEAELNESTFCHNHVQNFQQLRLVKQAKYITIAKALKMLHVLDFNGFSIKKFNSSSLNIQNMLN